MLRVSLTCLTLLCAAPVFADAPQVRHVTVQKSGGLWTFNVTVLHGDTGWDDYADGWRVVAMDGTVLGTRKLAHPHVNEQPFTRSLSGVEIPDGVTQVRIQVSDSVGGWAD